MNEFKKELKKEWEAYKKQNTKMVFNNTRVYDAPQIKESKTYYYIEATIAATGEKYTDRVLETSEYLNGKHFYIVNGIIKDVKVVRVSDELKTRALATLTYNARQEAKGEFTINCGSLIELANKVKTEFHPEWNPRIETTNYYSHNEYVVRYFIK